MRSRRRQLQVVGRGILPVPYQLDQEDATEGRYPRALWDLVLNVVPLGVVEAEEPLTNLCVCVGGGMLPREWCSLVSKGRGVCGVIARGERVMKSNYFMLRGMLGSYGSM